MEKKTRPNNCFQIFQRKIQRQKQISLMKTLKEILKEIEEASPRSIIEYNQLVEWLRFQQWEYRVRQCRKFGIGS
jgi:hypothetical protein